MSRSYRSLSFLLLLTLLVAASADARMTRDDVRTFPLSADGRLSLENINGDVTIEAWDQNEVSVESMIRAKSERALEEVEIAIDAADDWIRIETIYSDDRRYRREAASVDYMIRMPRTARVDGLELVNGSLTISGLSGDVAAQLVNGRAEASDLSGDVEIETVNGKLDVSLAELTADQSIKLNSVNGSLVLAMPSYADAEIDAETVHGRIDNDFGLEVDKDRYVGRELRGTLGSGGANVELENVNGSISIRQSN